MRYCCQSLGEATLIRTEYALKDISKPVGVSEYQLVAAIPENLKGSLPTIEELEAEFSDNAEEGNSSKE